MRPFQPKPARTGDEALALGRAWADHEAGDPGSLKGKPGEQSFFYFFDEVADWVDAPDMSSRRDLVYELGEAACGRWKELAEDVLLTWSTPDRDDPP